MPVFLRHLRHRREKVRPRPLVAEQLEDRTLLAALPPQALVSWYRAEGNASDFAGGNHGTLVGNTTFAQGKVGQAFSFDGNGDSVAVLDAPSLDLTTQLTLEAWVYPTADSGGSGLAGIILNKEQKAADGSGVTQYEIGRRNSVPFNASPGIPDGEFVFYLGGVTGLPNDLNLWVDAHATLPLNTWSHVALTFDGTAVRAYVNGGLTREIAVGGSLNVTNGELHVGGRDTDLNYGYWAGQIDEPTIYNRSLSASEIQSIAAAGSDGKATIVVNTTADTVNSNDGLTSLREALNQSNGSVGNRDVIGFNIPGSGVQTIAPISALPTITDPVIIDAYTQPGARANTNALFSGLNGVLQIQLSGANIPALTNGLTITGNSSTVRGLVINGFTGSGIFVDGGDNNTISGNYIGTDPTGMTAVANANWGVQLKNGASNNHVGTNGDGIGDEAERNLLSGNGFAGVAIVGAGSNGNSVAANLVGLNSAGSAAVGNANRGIAIYNGAQNNWIGTNADGINDAGEGNVVSGNGWEGIGLYGAGTTGNYVAGNLIGYDAQWYRPVPNLKDGLVLFDGASDNVVGLLAPNFIAFNLGDGISVVDAATVHNDLSRNYIYNNEGLGIDLGPDGPTANDLIPTADADTGPNNLQNYPVLTSALFSGGSTHIKGTLNSTANTTFRIEFFGNSVLDPSGYGEGEYAEGSIDVTTGADGVAAIDYALPFTYGVAITATATNLSTHDTSEFSKPVEGPSLVVTTTDDVVASDGFTSLREAILLANAHDNSENLDSEPDRISFSIPFGYLQTISPTTQLPTITEAVIIDGYTQPGAAANSNAIDDPDPTKRGLNGTLLIQISGPVGGTPAMVGLAIAASGCTVRGLVINGFANSGIAINGGNNNSLVGNYIGTDPTGAFAAGNGKYGIVIQSGSTGNRIGTDGDGVEDPAERNLIGGNGFAGIGIIGAGNDNNVVAGNFIGIDRAGTAAIGNANRGVDVFNGAQRNRIGTNADGVQDGAERNILSGNGWSGVGVYNAGTSLNVVAGNWIGVDVTGSNALANAKGGVDLFGGATGNTIGGVGNDAANLIAFNTLHGVIVTGPPTTGNSILGNSIFGNEGLGIDLGPTGATANDLTPIADADTGPNNLQNFPVLSYATRDAGKLKVKYNVPSDPANSTFPLRVEFFLADASGQGKTFVGFDTFTDADFTAGGRTVSLATAAPTRVFDKIVAAATDSLPLAAGGGWANTSEFSASMTIVSPWQNLNPGRLRWDVTDDTSVAPDDVLAIINYVNAKGSGAVPDNAANQQPYVDVDGDGNVVAADVLDVINYINAGRRLGGEAEAVALTAGPQPIAGDDLLMLVTMDVATSGQGRRRN